MKLIGLLLAAVALQAAEVKLLCSNGMRAVVEEVAPQWEKATGHKLSVEFNSANSIKDKMTAGAAFDAAVVTTEVSQWMVSQAKYAGAPKPLAKGGIGIGVKQGAAKPPVKTGEDLKKFFLNAKSVAYTANGASRPAIDRMFESLGIAPQMKAKSQLLAPGQAADRVAEGKAEVVLTLVSEILPIKGVELLAPLPEMYQGFVAFAGGVGAKASDAKAAASFIDFLGSAKVEPVLKAKGLVR